jgi:alkylation response protein AidB-like acyl-CoA dehydrogenase
MAAAAILTAVRELAPDVAARSEEIERERRLPLDLVARLREAGCFRTLVPRSHGGAGVDLPAELRAIEELARADGSVGWTVMIGRSAPVLLGRLPPPTFDAIYAPGPDVIAAGTSTHLASPRRSTAGSGSSADGPSPAAASTRTGSSPTAWWTTAASHRYG